MTRSPGEEFPHPVNRILIKGGSIVTMDPARRVIEGGGVVVRGNTIEGVLSPPQISALGRFDGEIVDASSLVVIPGFIQTHIHLCQTLFRGIADDLQLLDWLRLRIFPYEAAHDEGSMYASAVLGIAELLRSGTTTIMDMGSVDHEEAVIRAVTDTGLRAFVGKAMMDVNELYPSLKEPTEVAVKSTLGLAERYHGSANGRVKYAVAPRFVLSCTDSLLTEAYEMTRSFPGMLFHTHAAENRNEMEAVRKRCAMDNIEFFDSMNILHGNTCLAHCIWLNEREFDLLRRSHAKVLHCPSSNLKLGSGVANVPKLRALGITVSLGADGAPCNNTLNMFEEMRLAAVIQKPSHGPTAIDATSVFEMATLGGARALGLDGEIGSIETGKKADLVLLDLQRVWNPVGVANGTCSSIVYSGSPENVDSVMVDGVWVKRDGVLVSIDEEAVVRSARNELRLLLQRVH